MAPVAAKAEDDADSEGSAEELEDPLAPGGLARRLGTALAESRDGHHPQLSGEQLAALLVGAASGFGPCKQRMRASRVSPLSGERSEDGEAAAAAVPAGAFSATLAGAVECIELDA